MAEHRRCYDKYINNNYYFVSVFALFDEFGIENCKIVWIEDYPCNSKKELDAREGYYQQKTECVNKYVAGRNMQQYYQDKKNEILIKQKKYRDENPEKIKAQRKTYYEKKGMEMLEKRKQFRRDNPEIMSEYSKKRYARDKEKIATPYHCECGSVVRSGDKARHFKSNKHQQYLQSQTNPQE
jgi:hypothetical protein